MKRVIFFIFMTASVSLLAGQKFNPYENRWETVPDHYEIKYNAYESSWSYQPENAKIEYNPYESTWDWNSGRN